MQNMIPWISARSDKLFYYSVLCSLVPLIGCSNQQPGLQKVSGRVMFSDGQPVTGENSSVVFIPDASSANPPNKSASGIIEPDGSFVLMTNKPDDGAYHGSYKVILKVWEDYREQRSTVPEKYADVESTPLRAEIHSGTDRFEFAIDR